MKTKLNRAAVLAGMMALACGPAVRAQVKVWQGSITLPTYEEGQPDPNPPFDAFETAQFSYPYTLRTNLTGEKDQHVWRAVFLENEYLKCTVLPDIGGHLYTCVDKISGQPMFYANPSIKKAQIGYRGAWAAFGVEFNFPVSHNWVSMSPVDFAYAAHPDGSASISVGNIDRVYGMQWRIELVLRPGSTLLEEQVTLYNRSDVRHRYYWWNNGAVRVWDDSRIEYPMQFAAAHGFASVSSWPIDAEGKDLSFIKNQTDGPVSLFVHGSREPFMAIWNPKTQTGTAHYAEYSELPAKKIWSWGVDAAGMAWRKALSDNDSAYVEVQAGLFRNQETYAFLNPGQTLRFNEYWMPVRSTGGISRANKAGVVYFQSHGSEVSAALNVNQRIPGARIRLLQKGQPLFSETVDLTPKKMWLHSLPVRDPSWKLTFELKDHDGKMLLLQTDGEYDWDPKSTISVGPQPHSTVPDADKRKEGDWLILGMNQELNGNVVVALKTYNDALAKYPDSFPLQVAAGRLSAALQHFLESIALLRSAQSRDTPNAEVAYYLGIAEDGLGNTRAAQTSYEIAFRQAEFRGRAAARIAELRARQGNLQDAQRFFEDAVKADPMDTRSQEQLEAVVRAKGNIAHADQLARQGLAADPTSDFLKEDEGAPDLPHLAADPYRVLRVATEYMNLGLYQKALTMLRRTYPAVPADQSEPGSVLPQNNPLVGYYAAYCEARLGNGAIQNWRAAERLSPSLVFPSTTTDRAVLEAAIAANGKDATAHYLLGTLLFSKGLYSDGMEQWTETKLLDPKMPVLDADMGNAWLHVKNDPQRAIRSFNEGARNDPANPDIYIGLDEAMSLTGASAAERAFALGRFPSKVGTSPLAMPSNLVFQLALTRAEAGQYDQALALFKDRFFASKEGGVSVAQVLFEIDLMQAKTEAASGDCAKTEEFLKADHPGLVINKASSRAYVGMAVIAKTCHQPQQADQLLRKAVASESLADYAWKAKAEDMLGSSDNAWQAQELQAALAEAEHRTGTSDFPAWWLYSIGTIQAALHQQDKARATFEKTLLIPDNLMSHHLARAALEDLDNENRK